MNLDSKQFQELQNEIADRIYIKVENWNLYLGDAGLAESLAIECQANIDQGPEFAARKAIKSIEVKVGNGSTKIPLSSLIPSGQLFDLEEILSPYCR